MSRLLAVCSIFVLLVVFLLAGSSTARGSSTASVPSVPDWDPACYSTYPQIETFLQTKASQYPNIVSLIDGGLAWEGTRHLYALRLTSRSAIEKPAILLVGGQHPRDIATTEMLL